MAARGGARLQLQLSKVKLWSNFQNNLTNWVVFVKEFNELGNTIGLGLGWLRAVAQGYNYKCNTIELGSDFQKNCRSCGIKLSWGLDGCARWRKVTITIT